MRTLPTDSNDRKNYPIYRGFIRYFPYAAALISWISKRGNDKHNPGEPMHHARGKSMDHGDCMLRHLMDIEDIIASIERGVIVYDKEQLREELGQLGWRTCAYIQQTGEKYLGVPLAPGARLPQVAQATKADIVSALTGGFSHAGSVGSAAPSDVRGEGRQVDAGDTQERSDRIPQCHACGQEPA